jgi:hypothetical protein
VWQWVRNSDIPWNRRSLYAALLASTGKASDADELFPLLEKVQVQWKQGIIYSILSLNPKKYGPRIMVMVEDNKVPFLTRYSIWKATLQLYEAKAKGFTEQELLDRMAVFLDQPDMADIPISTFRQHKRWEYTDRILGLYEKNKAAIVRNAIIRYALQSPRPTAAAFVTRVRKQDPELVQYLEDELKDRE